MTSLTVFNQIATKIIKEQELIIGPLAWLEAGKVQGLSIVDSKKGLISFSKDDVRDVVDKLVGQYEHLFGRASHDVCRDAVASLIAELPPSDVPSSLQE